jgi:hypothetical protein
MGMAQIPTTGTAGEVDKKNIITLTVPYAVDLLDEVLSVGNNPPFGLTQVGRSFSQEPDGAYYIVQVKYEGIQGTPGSPGQPASEPVYEFDSGYTEENIEAHPDIVRIKKEYGGTEDKDHLINFDPLKPAVKGSVQGAGLGDFGKDLERNKMYGRHHYLALKATFRKTYTTKVLPADFLDHIGAIRKKLPAHFPTPKNRDWLVQPPKAILRGNVYEVTEEMILSEKGGWTEVVDGLYDAL